MPEYESVFDDPLMTPPTTDAPSGEWDDEGSLRGWVLEDDRVGHPLKDAVIAKEWEADGLTCLLLRITEYHVFGRFTQDEPDFGEGSTAYVGYVHAPGIESFPKGYSGVTIQDCYPDDGWFHWQEPSWGNRGYYSGKTMLETAIEKTERLASGLSNRVEENGGVP